MHTRGQVFHLGVSIVASVAARDGAADTYSQTESQAGEDFGEPGQVHLHREFAILESPLDSPNLTVECCRL